jgi:aspartate ammonia-lyase
MRIEEDFLGKVSVPDEAYYGSFTARADANFRLSGILVNPEITRAVALIKKCAALANMDLGVLERKAGSAIVRAADEIISGKYDREFVLDAFQAGAGTPLHMNVNEVIANRAEEILGGKKGRYSMVHPNNHVNMSQSSNDVVPTAIRIAALRLAEKVIKEGWLLQKSLDKKAAEYKSTMKIGRTHLQDAVPMTYGQAFEAYAGAVGKDMSEIEDVLDILRELGIGGTATGSGINTHPKFREKIVNYINRETSLGLRMCDDPVEMTQNMNDFVSLSGALRRYAITIGRIASDLRLLASGPRGGIAEIILKDVEPGSSIMPGKVNPSVPEAANMVAWQVMANDHAVLLASMSGQLELNFGTPLIAHNILQSEDLLANCSSMMSECVEGLEVDKKRTQENFEKSFSYATALNPYLGYKEVSVLVKEALSNGVSLKDLILKKGLMDRKDLEKVIATATGPSIIDDKIAGKVKRS